MVRKFFAILFLALFFLLVGPFLLTASVAFPFTNPGIIEKRIIPESYEVVAPYLLTLAREHLPPAVPRDKFEEWFRKEISQDTYTALLTEAFADIRKSMAINESRVASGVFEIELKSTKRALIQALQKIFDNFPVCPPGVFPTEESISFCMPGNISESQKQAIIQNLSEDLETKIPTRFVLQRTSQNAPVFMALEKILLLPLLRYLLIAVFLFPLLLMALILFRPVSRIFRYEGIAFLIASLEAFALMLLFKQLPETVTRLQELTQVQQDALTFFISFPVRFLFITLIILFCASALCFFFSHRLGSESNVSSVTSSPETVVIRPGKLRRGRHK